MTPRNLVLLAQFIGCCRIVNAVIALTDYSPITTMEFDNFHIPTRNEQFSLNASEPSSLELKMMGTFASSLNNSNINNETYFSNNKLYGREVNRTRNRGRSEKEIFYGKILTVSKGNNRTVNSNSKHPEHRRVYGLLRKLSQSPPITNNVTRQSGILDSRRNSSIGPFRDSKSRSRAKTPGNTNVTDITRRFPNTTVDANSKMKLINEDKWQRYAKLLMNLVKNPKYSSKVDNDEDSRHKSSNSWLLGRGNSTNLRSFFNNLTSDLRSAVSKHHHRTVRNTLLISAYSLLLLVSLFANLLVCHVVIRTRRLHTLTNTFLTNLVVSDLLMTVLNIPFSVARVLLDNWPFGAVMCCLVPFVQVSSVYVSSFTMVAIALDRYQVILRPLKRRMRATHGITVIAGIWAMAALLALPYGVFNRVTDVFTYTHLVRCQPHYPSPPLVFRRWLSLATILAQYVVPLLMTLLAYTAIVRRIWWQTTVGVTTKKQATLRLRAKKKTIKMLVVVVVIFAVCWLPLNAYHLVVDFSTCVGPSRHSSSVYFTCHWIAMSSVCYNPFIYCWLNDNFRAGARSWCTCLARKLNKLARKRDRNELEFDGDKEGDPFTGGRRNRGEISGKESRDEIYANDHDMVSTSSTSTSSTINCIPFNSSKRLYRDPNMRHNQNGRPHCSSDSTKTSMSIKILNKSELSSGSENNENGQANTVDVIHIPLRDLVNQRKECNYRRYRRPFTKEYLPVDRDTSAIRIVRGKPQVSDDDNVRLEDASSDRKIPFVLTQRPNNLCSQSTRPSEGNSSDGRKPSLFVKLKARKSCKLRLGTYKNSPDKVPEIFSLDVYSKENPQEVSPNERRITAWSRGMRCKLTIREK